MPKKNDEAMKVDLAVLATDVRYIRDEVSEIKNKLEKDYVLRSEVDPIKRIVYGMVGLILTAVLAAGLTFILKR